MRKIFCSIALAAAASGVLGQEKVAITGILKDMKPKQWVYFNSAMSENATDSVQSVAGGFQMTVSIPADGGDMYVIHIGYNYEPGSYILVYMDKGNVAINGEGPMFKNAVSTGGAGNSALKEYETWLKSRPELAGREDLQKRARELFQKHDTTALKALQPQLMLMDSLHAVATVVWVVAHKSSPISAYLLGSQLSELEASKRAELFDGLTADAKKNAPANRSHWRPTGF